MRISIHALRGEGDEAKSTQRRSGIDFYPRPPRGGRPSTSPRRQPVYIFLSTPSAGRATTPTATSACPTADFYPRPPRGGRQRAAGLHCLPETISIHALRGEGDRKLYADRDALKKFLSTPSAGRATAWPVPRALFFRISIHALRGEGDKGCGQRQIFPANFYPRPPRGGRLKTGGNLWKQAFYFYPRPPRGGRLAPLAMRVGAYRFLSTPSAGRATGGPANSRQAQKFLSTPSAGRATAVVCWFTAHSSNFYPRPPRGGRHTGKHFRTHHGKISIHALRGEGDRRTG